MYSIQDLKESSKTTMNIQKKTNHILCGENNEPFVEGQKDNVFQSIRNFLTSFGESFLRMSVLSLSKRNNTLSVTIVNDEGKINTEIIKCLLDKEKVLNINTAYAFNIQREEPSTTTEKLYDALLGYNKNEDITKTNNESINVVQNLRSNINFNIICKNSSEIIFQSRPHVHTTEMSNDMTDNSCKTETDLQKYIDSDKDTSNNTKNVIRNYVYNEEGTSVDTESYHIVRDLDIPLHFINSAKEISMSTRVSDMCRKIWNNVTDRFSSKMESTCYEDSVKCLNSKQQKRDNSVVMHRDCDRGKSLSKRSRGMRSKHQKERTKHDLAMDIQDDYETWQEVQVHHTVQNDSLLDNSSLDDSEYEFLDIPELMKQVNNPEISKFSHNISMEQKPKTNKIMNQENLKYSTRVRYIPEHSMERNYYKDCNNRTGCDLQNNQFRPRLISESSSDSSEDSYCITFESGSEIDCITNIDYEETSTEDSEDDEDVEEKTKVFKNSYMSVILNYDIERK